MILLDTNILARLANQHDPDYGPTWTGINGCRKRGWKFCIANQALQEFWVVATRTVSKNGLGMAPDRADRFMSQFIRTFTRLEDPAALFDAWRSTVNFHSIVGIRAYDARFAAFVQARSLQGIMTYNLAVFAVYPIKLLNPKDPATW